MKWISVDLDGFAKHSYFVKTTTTLEPTDNTQQHKCEHTQKMGEIGIAKTELACAVCVHVWVAYLHRFCRRIPYSCIMVRNKCVSIIRSYARPNSGQTAPNFRLPVRVHSMYEPKPISIRVGDSFPFLVFCNLPRSTSFQLGMELSFAKCAKRGGSA